MYVERHPASQLGQFETIAAFASTASSGASFFSKIFGGAKTVYPSRQQRAAGTVSAVDGAMARFPPELANYVNLLLARLFSTGLSCEQYAMWLVMPVSVLQAFISSPASQFAKPRSIAAMRIYQERASRLMPAVLGDSQWM